MTGAVSFLSDQTDPGPNEAPLLTESAKFQFAPSLNLRFVP
jgi:hypothetical protein